MCSRESDNTPPGEDKGPRQSSELWIHFYLLSLTLSYHFSKSESQLTGSKMNVFSLKAGVSYGRVGVLYSPHVHLLLYLDVFWETDSVDG